MEGGVAGSLRVVLVRDRRTEESHYTVASILINRPLEAVNAVGKDPEETVKDTVPLLGIDLLGEIHRAFHVCEEHGYLLALAFEGATRSQDLLGEVLRGVGAGVRWWPSSRGLIDALPAVPAELLPWLVLCPAGGADDRELRAALSAEFSAGSIVLAAL
jgi:hypothetical protein